MQVLLTLLNNEFGDPQKTMVSQSLVLIDHDQRFVVGRHPDCDFCITQDGLVSGRHFRIENVGKAAVLHDLGSTNGTFLNGNRISSTVIEAGDQIQAGNSYFKVGVIHDEQDEGVRSSMKSISFDKEDAAAVDYSAVVTPEAEAEVEPSIPLQVAIEIPRSDSGGLSIDSISQMLPIVEANESHMFGRTAVGADMMIRQDNQMSSSHFEIRNDGTHAWIEDLDSTNGLFLNGVRIRRAMLRHQDIVLAGATSFRVHLYGGEPPTEEMIQSAIVQSKSKDAPTMATVKAGPFQAPRLVHETPFEIATLKGRINYPGYSLTVIVKATYDIHPEGVATLADEQLPLSGDVTGASESGVELLEYPSDFAFFKPSADIVFHGACYPPHQQPAKHCRPRLKLGHLNYSLDVYGDRFWTSRLSGGTTEPSSFHRMPITHDRAFGGTSDETNPAGRGVDKIADSEGSRSIPLPNLVAHEDARSSERSSFRFVGMAPISAEWQLRKKRLGTFDSRWQATRVEWFPEDLDWRYFNAATPELQYSSYLRGDEQLELEHLHPEYNRIQSQLPGTRIRCFVCAAEHPLRSSFEEAQFREVTMNLDTAWIDGDASKLVLVWRGSIDVSHTFHPEIKQIFCLQESIQTPKSAPGLFWKEFLSTLKRIDEVENIETASDEMAESPLEESPAEEAVNDPFATIDSRSPEQKLAAVEDDANKILIANGIDPKNPPPLTPAQEQQKQKLLEEWGLGEEDDDENDEVEEVEIGIEKRRLVKEYIAQGKSLDGIDLTRADLSKLNLAGISFVGTDLTNASLRKADLTGSKLSGAILIDADLTSATLTSADLTDAICIRATAIRTNMEGTNLTHADFSSATLQSTRLRRCNGVGTLFISANLSHATVDESDLSNSLFDQAKLNQASFLSCQLESASFGEATGERCDFSNAQMNGAIFRKSTMVRSSFQHVEGEESVWTEAELTDSNFRAASLTKSDFAGAILDECNFEFAILKESRFAFSSMRNAFLVRTNLFRTNLEAVDLTHANLSCSSLYGAELLDATFDNTRCESTNLKSTKLQLAARS